MTKQELNHHRALVQHLEKNRKLLESLEVAGLYDEAADIRDNIASLDTEVKQSEAVIMAWINTIDDPQTRTIIRLRFLRGFEWKTVATLIGAGNTRYCVERRASRYLEAHHDK